MRANPWSFHRLSDLTSHSCLLGITCLVTKFIIIIIIIISTWQTHMYRTRRLTSLVLIVIPEYLMIMICAFYLHFEISRLCTNIYVPERAACQGLSPTDTICTVYCYRYHAMCISVHLDFSHLNSELTAVCTNIPTNVDKSLTCLCWSHETIVTCHVFGEEEKRLGVKHNTSSYE